MNLEKKETQINLSFKEYINQQKNLGTVTFNKDNISDYAYTGDKQAMEVLTKFEKVKTAIEPMLRLERDAVKADLLGGGVKVTPDQFPKIYNSLVYCSKKLGIPVPEAFVHQKIEINAFTLGTTEDAVIVMNNGLVDRLTEEELRFVIGHECGHIQNGHVPYSFMTYLMTRIARSMIGIFVMPFLIALKHWSRQAEITSDRAGLICCGDINQAKQVMIKSALGSKELFKQVNMEEYMAQLEELKDNVGRFSEFFSTHPHLPKRVAALELYEKSDNFLSKKTGVVNQGLSLTEIDQKIAGILKIL